MMGTRRDAMDGGGRAVGRAAAAGAALLLLAGLGFAAPRTARAADEDGDANTGTTAVTVMTADTLEDIDDVEDYDISADDLLSFEVPTVIPFVAKSSGELVGPSAAVTCIRNHSAFGIHVVQASVVFEEGWAGVSDVEAVEDENAIDFQFGPTAETMTDAADDSDDDVSDVVEYNMTYEGGASDSVGIETAGDVARVTKNLVAGTAQKIATITWTISAGNAVEADGAEAEDETADEDDGTADGDDGFDVVEDAEAAED